MTDLYICITIFSRIKILMFFIEIMTQQLFKLNYFLLSVITKTIHIILRKPTFIGPKLLMSFNAYCIPKLVIIYLLSSKLTQYFPFTRQTPWCLRFSRLLVYRAGIR
jgi:hypothetical protein